MDFHTEFKPVTVQPQQIEGRSFEMINEEIGEHSFTDEQYPIVRRMIHASADFELGKSVLISSRCGQAGIRRFEAGKKS